MNGGERAVPRESPELLLMRDIMERRSGERQAIQDEVLRLLASMSSEGGRIVLLTARAVAANEGLKTMEAKPGQVGRSQSEKGER